MPWRPLHGMWMRGDVNNKDAILRWLPALAWMALIFYLSSQPDLPGPPNPLWDLILKQGAHFVAYAVLAILFSFALAPRRETMTIALVLSILYALSDEFHQSFVPGRTPSAWDIATDTAGALFALYALRRHRLTAGRARSSHDRRDPTGGAPSA